MSTPRFCNKTPGKGGKKFNRKPKKEKGGRNA